jgi:ligand-binding SRPBCC domain-containing protein
MAVFQLRKAQFIPAGIDEVWDFISSPANLKKITPPHMGFDITSGELPEKMYPGMIITYRVKPLAGIGMKWVTEITHVSERSYFVDEQRVGPYAMWHHEHHLEAVEGGVMMRDVITYRPPLGFLGALANRLFIRKQLDGIFEYRSKALENIYPPLARIS